MLLILVFLLSFTAKADILESYDYLEQGIVPATPLKHALEVYDKYQSKICNKKYLTVIDMTKPSYRKRMFLINMSTGEIDSYYVSHGKGSDANNDGWAERFSNVFGSKMTSVGLYQTSGTYLGGNGLSLNLRGLNASNSNAYSRRVVVHGASYVKPGWAGRSWGCPAVETRYNKSIIDRIKGGSFLYIWGGAKNLTTIRSVRCR